ncbi:MAG: DUF1840 domain-containing protein [Rhodoferax sp.]|uniref:DUF1840 domain-containing protein n=1 Tax=Rhodoferax sp. TaxID=50421 RepID=UPI002628365D|nr:DUF1840 domain-containing protein [Rhodoferax sp.]MDD2882788.1 DUF1840 domain-containing protein [Rhodoferax sp.]
MLYKFKSKAAGDVIMLQPNGQRVLEIIGKHSATDPSLKGILLPEQMPQALIALQAAVEQEEAQRQAVMDQAKAENLPAPHFDAISLRQRALPFMDMIRECLGAKEAITWGV